ncbi:hypothetical protein BGZ54_007681 [Gamsiella multidivaricata]|nr:hypothetical protein BGZ54_007681 [Gamsiella multidivaricata]
MYAGETQHQQYLRQLQQQQLEQQQQQVGTNTPAREFTVVAIGKSGEGKSTLLNAILSKEIFPAKASVSEVTQRVDQASNHFLNIASNPIIHCIDTPSFNGQLHNPNRVNEIGTLLTKVAAGVDAFLFVVNYDNTFHQTLQTYQGLFTPAFWPKVLIVFTHATPELLPPATEARLQLLAWSRQIQEDFKLPSPPLTVFSMDYARFPYPSGGAQEFWEALMTLDANTAPYSHKPFLESFGNGIAMEGYVQRIKGHLAQFEPSFFEDQAEEQFNEMKRKESRFSSLFRKSGRSKRLSDTPSATSTPQPSAASPQIGSTVSGGAL